MTRPDTASVRVTEFGLTSGINPQPLKIEEDTSELLDEFLSPRKLRALTGVDNLEQVDFLEMQVDADGASLGNFGMYVPNLRQLKLSNSIIGGVRDLGTSLNNLEVLWMPRCCLECLDGLVSMSNLRELYLAYNEIRDVSPCGMLEYLEILDLEGNFVADYRNLSFLSMCEQLKRLSLEGNPICLTTCPEDPEMSYRSLVIRALPQLTYLDDIPTTRSSDVTSPDQSISDYNKLAEGEIAPPLHTATLEFDAHWEYINNLLKDTGLMAESEQVAATAYQVPETTTNVPGTAGPRLGTSSGRPCSTLRPSTAQRRATGSSRGRMGTASSSSSSVIRPMSSASGTSLDEALEGTDESILTAGNVVCGNISKALRKRRAVNGLDTDRSSESGSTNRSRPTSTTSMPASFTRPSTAGPQLGLAAGLFRLNSGGPIERRGAGGVAQGSGKGLTTTREEPVEIVDYEDVLKDLKEWRKNYQISREEVEKERAPQVMTISHDECIELDSNSPASSQPTSENEEEEEDSDVDSFIQQQASRQQREPELLGATGGAISSGGLVLQSSEAKPPMNGPRAAFAASPVPGGNGINKMKVVPQIPATKAPISLEGQRPSTAMPALGGKLRTPLAVLPSKPSVRKP